LETSVFWGIKASWGQRRPFPRSHKIQAVE
jgi:hypothetical protein